MSAKKKVIFGPDGRPYVPPPPKPEPDKPPEATKTPFLSTARASLADDYIRKMLEGSLFHVPSIVVGDFVDAGRQRGSFRDLVAEQIAALVPADMETAPDELSRPPQDLTAYADAFASAAKNCTHPNYEDTVYARREAYCPDCRRVIRRPRGMFG